MVLAVSGFGLQSDNFFPSLNLKIEGLKTNPVQMWIFQLKVHLIDSHAHKGHIDFQIQYAPNLLNNILQVKSYTQCLVAEVS